MPEAIETTNPVTEVVTPEARLEALFSKQEKGGRPAEPDEGETQAEEVEETPTEDAAGDGQAEPDGEGSETDEATDEVEFEGKTYALPKELKDAFLKNKDYTEKTQSLAEKRRTVEEREAAVEQTEKARAAIFEQAIKVQAVEQRLQAYAGVDWAALADQNPTEYLKLDRAYRALQEQHAQAREEVQRAVAQDQQASATQRQQMLERGNAELAREIKGWGPELGKKLLENAKTYGYTEAEMAQVVDPRQVRMFHDAYLWRQLQAAKPGIVKKVENVKPVVVKTARTTQTTQAEGQAAADRARLKKTGDAKSAENYLTSLFERKRKR